MYIWGVSHYVSRGTPEIIKVQKAPKHIPDSVKDHLVSEEIFQLQYDHERSMLVTTPQPSKEELPSYYESEAYISHTDGKKGLMPYLYQTVKKYALSKKLRLITILNRKPGTLLDIGAGTGEFLKLAKQYGWEISGVEVSEKARAFSKQKGIDLQTSIDRYKGQQFDVITLWHVLEHLPDLENTITKIEALLRPGGSLVVAVPNFNAYDAKFYKQFWAAYDVPRHLWHFSKATMKVLFSEEMKLEKTKPMILDSFYVSLISEKYRSGKSFSILALLIGLWSNIAALRSKQYSSHIYCFRKAK